MLVIKYNAGPDKLYRTVFVTKFKLLFNTSGQIFDPRVFVLGTLIMSKFKHKNGKEMEYEKKKVDRIPDETINYYKRVSETLNEDFSSDEDKGMSGPVTVNRSFRPLIGLNTCGRNYLISLSKDP